MNRTDMLATLCRHKPEMQRRFSLRSLALFGSRAREESHDGSDIDILVEFDDVATSERYFGLQFFLEDLLGAPVDLVTRQALRPQLRPFIERDAIHV
jgi:uncharacterized protein